MNQVKEIIFTKEAPRAVGTYSQAVKTNNLVFISGQIPLDAQTMQLVADDFVAQCHQVFKNLAAVAVASGGSLENIVKLNIYVLDLANFGILNEIMSEYFQEPYPARAAVGVAQLPKDAQVEIEAIMMV